MNMRVGERVEEIRAYLDAKSYDVWVPSGASPILLMADDGDRLLVLVGLTAGLAAARRSAHQVRHQARSIEANRLVVMLVQPSTEEEQVAWVQAVAERGTEREILSVLLPLPEEPLGTALSPLLGLSSVVQFLAEIQDEELVASLHDALAETPENLRKIIHAELSRFLRAGSADDAVFQALRAELGLQISGGAS